MDIIDLAMHNLKKNGVQREDTLEYAIDHGKTTQKTPLTEEERERFKKNEITRTSMPTQREVTRIYIRQLCKTTVDGLDDEELAKTLIECYNSQKSNNKCYKVVQEKFNVDRKTAEKIVYMINTQARVLSDWTIAKEKKLTHFTLYSPYNNQYEGQEFPIDDLMKYLSFIIENNASPNFWFSEKRSEELKKKIKLRRVK